VNSLIILTPVAAVAILTVFVMPRTDRWTAWCFGAFMALVVGLRRGGFDYDEYLTMIVQVRSLQSEDISNRLFLAKDPLFLLIIEISGFITTSPVAVFLFTAVPSILLKVAATAIIPGRRTLFIVLYGLLLAPGLEFAAIRAGLALGFLLVGLHVAYRSGWWAKLLAIASHSSMLIPVILQAIIQKPLVIALLTPVALVILIAVAPMIIADTRYTQYFSNHGNYNALVLPVMSMVASLLIVCARSKGGAVPPTGVLSLLCAALALILALPAVTVAYRILEICWVLMLFDLLHRTKAKRGSQRLVLVVAWVFWFSILMITNILRQTWIDMASI
jgi:uncharacterized MnhB-related membrane protein